LIVSGLADVAFNTLVRVALLAATFVVYQLPLSRSLLLAPLGLMALLMLGLAIGVLVTPVGLLYSDVGRAIGLASGFWMLLTPVVYPPPASGLGAFLARWNPVSPIVLTTREWLTAQPTTSLTAFWWVTGLSTAGLALGWVFFRLSVPHVVERMGN
jgi:lipopolysaccharide transport system permease protein